MDNHSKKEEKLCAYCKSPGPFTKEHITPSFLYKKLPDHKFGYHPKADQFLTYEATIRDVCGQCNSGPLSKLDKYGEFFYSKNRCYREFNSLRWVPIEYDYNLLLRWLLKISYNAMRALDYDNDLIRGCVPFILSGENFPYNSEILVEIVRNYKIKEREREHLPKEIRDWKYLPADSLRVGQSIIVSEQVLGRFIAIKAFYFDVFISSNDCPPKIYNDLLTVFREKIPDAKKLDPEEKLISITTSRRTMMDAYKDQGTRIMEPWIRYKTSKIK
jgi:hypothetical protein